jgi:hypothetical protein
MASTGDAFTAINEGIKKLRRGVGKGMRNQACEKTPSVYVYKLTTDNGGAPATYRGLLSLAICKPKIRAKAEVGDWLIGIAGKSLRPGAALIYVAQVTQVLEGGSYYSDRRFSKRPDAVYEWRRERLRIKSNARFHDTDDTLRDVGSEPLYRAARVLLSDKYRYFGKLASDWYASISPHAHSSALGIGRAHRVNHSDEDYDAWMKVIRATLRKPQLSARPIEAADATCRH